MCSNGKKSITVKLTSRDLEPFYKLRQTSFEIGGILDVSENGLVRSGMVVGTGDAVNSSQLPDYAVHYHTHPSFPSVPFNKNPIDHALEIYNRESSGSGSGTNFPIDIVFQSVSGTDLSTFSTILHQNKSQAMLIFAPEGIYVLTSNQIGLDDYINLTIDKAHDMFIQESKNYIKVRNELITRLLEEITSRNRGLNKEISTDQITSLQKKAGHAVADLITSTHTFLNADFYPWTVKEISITLSCSRVIDAPPYAFTKLN
jgi:hypothetical protein